MHKHRYPHPVHGSELDGDVQVLDPKRGILGRYCHNLANVVGLGIDPDVAEEQARLLAFWNDVQNVLWSRSEVLLRHENEVIIRSADVALMSCPGSSFFLLQNGIYDLYTFRATLLFRDFECFAVRGNEIDVCGCFRVRFWIV